MMSMSSVELDTHRLSISGPVTSVSSFNGVVSKDTPILFCAASISAVDEDATPALVTPLAE